MFKLKNITPQYKDTYVGGSLYKVVYVNADKTEEYICLMSSWTLGCCGARSLFQFDNYSPFWTDERVDEFFQFLDESDTDLYYSREVYFMLSDLQADYMESLIAYSGTKRVDQFTNRGTGGKGNMSLYRWSSEMPDEEDEDEEDEE